MSRLIKCSSLKRGEAKGRRHQLAAQPWQGSISHHNALCTVSSHSCTVFSLLLFLYDGSGWNQRNLIAKEMPLRLIAGGSGMWWFIRAELRGVCCSSAADTEIIVVFSLRAAQSGDSVSRMSHSKAQSGKSVIPLGMAQNVPQHCLDWTVWDWPSDTRGLNEKAESIEVVSWEGCTPPGSFPHDKKCLYMCCVNIVTSQGIWKKWKILPQC